VGEEMLRSFLDLVVLRHDGFASGSVCFWRASWPNI
jgi:hypothetical protein